MILLNAKLEPFLVLNECNSGDYPFLLFSDKQFDNQIN